MSNVCCCFFLYSSEILYENLRRFHYTQSPRYLQTSFKVSFFFQKKKSIKGRSIKGGNKEKKRKECKRFLKECKKYAALNLLYLHSLFSSGSKRCRSCMGSTIAASHSEKRLIKRTWLNRFCNSLSQSPCSFPLRAYCDVEIPG